MQLIKFGDLKISIVVINNILKEGCTMGIGNDDVDVELGKQTGLAPHVDSCDDSEMLSTPDEEPLKSTADIALCSDVSDEAVYVGAFIEIVKAIVYLVAMINVGPPVVGSGPHKVDIPTLFSFVYATLATATAGFKTGRNVLVYCGQLSKSGQEGFRNDLFSKTGIVKLLLLLNTILLYMATVYTIPTAGGPIDIILNATALISVMELDFPIYEVLNYDVIRNRTLIKKLGAVELEYSVYYKKAYLSGSILFYILLVFCAAGDI